jgi:hypothetical protein
LGDTAQTRALEKRLRKRLSINLNQRLVLFMDLVKRLELIPGKPLFKEQRKCQLRNQQRDTSGHETHATYIPNTMTLFAGTTGFANNQLRFDVQRLTLYVRRINTCGQERDGAFGDRFNRLGNDGQSWMEVFRPFKVVKAHDRNITGNVKPNGVQVLHQSHH